MQGTRSRDASMLDTRRLPRVLLIFQVVILELGTVLCIVSFLAAVVAGYLAQVFASSAIASLGRYEPY